MRVLLFVFGLSLLLTSAATARGLITADTLRGEARLTGYFTQGLCEQLAMQSRHQNLAVLTKSQGMELLNEVIMAVIVQDSTEFKTVLAQAPDPVTAMQRMSMQAILRLSGACPTASRLLVQMGVQMAAVDTTLTPAQQRTLQEVAHSFCEKLTAADARQAFSQRTASERLSALRAARHEVILAYGAALGEAFGPQLLTSEQLENNMWQNVDRLMFDDCRTLTAQLRIDRGLAQLQADSEAAAAPTPGQALPRPAVPARRSSRKK